MRDSTDPQFQKIQEVHRTGRMVGLDRPVTRCTWARQSIQQIKSTKSGMGAVRYLSKTPDEYEFTGIRTVEIQRSIGQDAATCTIVLYNFHGSSSHPEGIDTAGRKGYLTPGRGDAIPTMTSVFNGVDLDFGMGFGTSHTVFPTAWGYTSNMYRDIFVPNRVIRTYQGYGSDNFDVMGNEIYVHDPDSAGYVLPQHDSKLYQTGTWLIDKVTLDAGTATMTLECRDLAKLLIEQYVMPPLLPLDRFPLIYCPAHHAQGHKESIGKNVATYHSSSVDHRYGHNAAVLGHRGSHAFDNRSGSFWLSGANSSHNDFEWLQAKTHGSVNEVVLNCYGGNYIVYISVHENGRWQGSSSVSGSTENLTDAGFFYVIAPGDTLWDLAYTYYGDHFLWPIIARANNNIIKDPHWIYPGQRIKIPYVNGTRSPYPSSYTGTSGTNVTIPYVVRATVPSNGQATIRLPRSYKADYVRVVMTNLDDFGGANNYRAGVREMAVRNHVLNTYIPSNVGKSGFIQDWTEPIKELAAWAGFTWEPGPRGPTKADPVIGNALDGRRITEYQQSITILERELKNKHLTGAQRAYIQNRILQYQAVIAGGVAGEPGGPMRIWGDFETLGAGPIACTPGDYFIHKSFMDAIRQIVDFMGAILFIDESGGLQFRLANIWTSGNFIADPTSPHVAARIKQHPIELHEDVNLLNYTVVTSDASVRSEILVVGGYDPKLGPRAAAAPVAGGYVLGYNSYTHTTSAIDFTNILGGQYRLMIVPGDSTKLFYTERECQRMAELTALFILFTYRQAAATIPGHPGLQLDDQVRIFERSTYETNIHYVSGITSSHDLESGHYTMDLTTHWLGNKSVGGAPGVTGTGPDTAWFVNKAQLTPAVASLPSILARIDKQAAGDPFETFPYTG